MIKGRVLSPLVLIVWPLGGAACWPHIFLHAHTLPVLPIMCGTNTHYALTVHLTSEYLTSMISFNP